MAGEQDIVSLGLNIDSFNEQKMKVLKTYISIFNDLSKFDGKIFNPVMGDGLSTFNSSIAQTSRLLEDMNSKIAIIQAANSRMSQSSSSAAKSNTELSLSMAQYARQADSVAVTKAKLAALTSEEAKQNMALKLQLSETTKAILEEAKANNQSIQAKIASKARSEEYKNEQMRVVAVLRQLAVEQDRLAKQDEISKTQAKKLAAQEYRAEKQRVVATLRQLALEQDRAAANDERERRNTKNLISDYQVLRKTLNDQANAYATLYQAKGADNKETKAALANYAATAGIINSIDKNLSKAGGAASGLTTGLSRIWSGLLRVAYILPGLGIAGIFNIAFDAISKAAEAIGVFNKGEEELIRTQALVVESINKQVDAMNDLYEARDKFFNQYLSTPYGLGIRTYSDIEKDVESTQARGFNQRTILTKELELAQRVMKDARSALLAYADPRNEGSFMQGNLTKIKDDMLQTSFKMGSLFGEIQTLNERIANKTTGEIGLSKSEAEEQVKLNEALLNSQKIRYEQLEKILSNYINAETALKNKQLEIEKFEADQARKLALETSKIQVEKNLEKNKAILDSNKKFHDDKEAAIKSNYQQEVNLAAANLKNVIDNLASENEDKIIAQKNYDKELEKAKLKRDKELERNDVEFYQRKILALTEIQKDEIEMESIKQERIFLNETKHLSERLDAYENYIILRQKLKDLEYSLAIQRDAAMPDGATSLTPEEQERLGVHKRTQKFNIQADAENRTYDIVKTSLDRQIKEVKTINDTEEKINKEAYAKELQANNDRFKNRLFAYEAFKREKERIDRKYRVILSIEDEMKDNEQDVARLKTLYEDLLATKEESDRRLAQRKGELELDKEWGVDTLDSERLYNEELGANTAFSDALLKARDEMNQAIEKGENDKVKAAKARYDQLIQFEKEYLSNKRAIEEAGWELASQFINREVEQRIQAIRDITQTRQEHHQLEQDAIEDSSLSAKDKAALDIQLTQQKIEADKAAAVEERKIKYDAAVKDRELAIAHVIWNSIESVTSALKIAPPAGEILAGQRAILGAINLAQILASPLPSYSDGTENHPGGFARYGEDGAELVAEPGKKPFIALTETISDLAPGTKVVPLTKNSPIFDKYVKDESWEQTMFLAKEISKSNKKEIRNVFKPTILVDMNFESRKRQILGN